MNFLKSKSVVNFGFFTCLIFCVLSFMVSIILNQHDFYIPYFNGVNSDIRLNIEVDKKEIPNIHLMVNGMEIPKYVMQTKNSYFSYSINNFPINTLTLKVDKKDTSKKIKNMVLFNGDNFTYYTNKDLLSFEKNKNGEYIFPNESKYLKTSTYYTDKGFIKAIQVSFLAIFYNMKFFIIPLILLSLTILIYQLNRDKIDLGFNFFKKASILWIIILAIIFRIADNGYNFWSDEIYTAAASGNPNLPFKITFMDPGNPPFFFILARYWQLIFGQNESLLRLLPTIFSILTIPVIYIFTKKYTNKNIALLSSFLFTINIYSIHSSQEFRCYSLCALFSILSGYYLFKIIEEKNKKDFIIYTILAILMANTHYFQILILISNFIVAMIFLDNKNRLKFFIINLISALSFLPFFIMTAMNKGLLDNEFNILQKNSIMDLVVIYSEMFFGKICAILSIVLLITFIIFKFKNKDKNFNLYFYSIFSIISLLVLSLLFSILIKPIIKNVYFINILPFVSIVVGYGIYSFKGKFGKILSVLFILFGLFSFSQTNIQDREMFSKLRLEEVIKFAKEDRMNFKNKKINIMVTDYIEYSSFYKNLLSGDENLIKHKLFSKNYNLFKILIEKEPEILYASMQNINYPAMSLYLYPKYTFSLIKTDDDVIVARIVRN